MDIILASDGSWKECPIAPQEFDTLHQLSLAVSKLTSLDISNLILFLSTGQELSDNVFQDIWETNGKSLHGAAFGRQSALGNSHLEGSQSRVLVVVFDRRSFTADPEDWSRSQGVEEVIHLEKELDAHPVYDDAGDPLTPVFSNHAHMHHLSQRIRNQTMALRIAGNNLLDHLAGLEDAVLVGPSASGHHDGPIRGSTQRKRRKPLRTTDVRSPVSESSASDQDLSESSSSLAASEAGGSEAEIPAQRSWKMVVDAELARERRLLGVSDPSTYSNNAGVFATPAAGPDRMANPNPIAWSGIERDMTIIGRVPVFSCFLPRTVGSKGKGKDRKDGATQDDVPGNIPDKWSGKMLGDFVNPGKMRTVSESCKRIYDDHVSRYQSLLSSLSSLRVDAAEVTSSIEQLVDEVDGEVAALLDLAERDSAEAERLGHEELDVHWESLRSLDASVREQLMALTALKNDFTLQLHILLHQISVHQSTIASLPPLLSALEDTLVSTRTLAKTGFPHLQRLHNMLFAYGSSCIEVVWRKEVHSLLLRDSGSLAENLAHRLGKELHRREIFEANILGLLPWTIDVLGSKADKPSLQISTRGGADQLSDWTITIEDVKGLIKLIGGLGEGQGENVQGGSAELLRVQSRLARQLHRMHYAINALRRSLCHAESKSVMSPNTHPQVLLNGDSYGESLRHDQERTVVLAHERAMLDLREQHAAEVSALQFASQQAIISLQDAEARKMEVENKLEVLEDLRQQVAEQQDHASELEREIAEANHRSHEQAVELEELRKQLRDSKDAHMSDIAHMHQLQGERSQLLSGLGDARSSEDQLAAQLLGVQTELTSTLAALEEAQADRDQALRDQSADAERMIRDHLTEADGDRAVLEHQNLTLAKQMEDLRNQSESDVMNVRNTLVREADGLKAELGLAKAQLREAQRLKTQLQDELSQEKDALAHSNQETKRQRDVGRDAIRVASAFHDCVSRLHLAIQSSATISGSSLLITKPVGDTTQALSADQHVQATTGTVPEGLEAKDGEDEDEAALRHELATLKTYELHTFADAVTRTMSLVKKWQKSCKQYRDKARDKLAFSNFAKGDLALFLPTRNSTVNSWAAFNVSSPHNFLKPTRAMEEQIKVRDWIVARIVRIEEMVVDSKRLESNPYQLADGIRFFILHVEEYIPVPPRARRSISGNVLDNSTVPLPSTNSLDEATPMAALSSGTRRTDYFSTHSVPAPSSGWHGTRVPPTDRRRSSLNDGPFRSLSPHPSTPQEGMLPPPDSSALPASLRRPSSGIYETPFLQARQTSHEPRRPPSIASSNGSFRVGIQYASSNKAASTSAVTRALPEPARIASSTNVPMVADVAQARGADQRSLSPPPPSTTAGALMPGSFRPRLGSQTQGGLGAFLRRDSTSSSPAPTSQRPTGTGEGALEILKRLDTNPTS